jgi:hypothetical protein
MVMQSAQLANLDHGSLRRRLSLAWVRCLFVEREMRSLLVVISEICRERVAERALAEDNDMSRHSRRREPMTRST